MQVIGGINRNQTRLNKDMLIIMKAWNRSRVLKSEHTTSISQDEARVIDRWAATAAQSRQVT